jgi:hypothetical protein
LFFVHPFFAMRILTGEMKGSDVAMAQIERRPFRRWPFFSVYDGKAAGFWTYATQRFLLDGFYPSQPSWWGTSGILHMHSVKIEAGG